MTGPASHSFARAVSWFWRFRSLARAERVFRTAEPPLLLRRRLFGHDLYLDVGRGPVQQMLYLESEGFIEPSPENLAELRMNIEENAFANVRLFEVALGRHQGPTGLRDGVNSGVVAPGEGAYQVEMRTLDDLLDERVDFIKIDVDGYEGHVLEGAQQVLRRDRPILFLEFHPHLVGRHDHSLSSVLELLAPHYGDGAERYEYYEAVAPEHAGLWHKIATRYLNRDSATRITDLRSLFDACGRHARTRTFWIVCGRDT